MISTFKPNTIVVIIDTGVENYQQLIDGVEPEAKTFLLDQTSDGIEQISQVLQLHPETNALHIISHGSPGCLYLGNGQLSLDTLGRYAPQLQRWKLDNLLLYGCNVAAGDAGEELIAKLHHLTGAEIAASSSLTGAAVKGGNWELEVTTGKVNLPPALKTEVMATYSGVFNLEIALTISVNGDNKGRGIATDSDGNVWVTGFFNGSIDDLMSNGGTDSYLVKIDSNGDLVKALNIGGSGNDQGYSITTDSDNNAWAIGYFNGSIDINGDDNNDLTSNGGTDNYVAKFDPDGTLLFALNIGGSSNDEGTGIATDSDGNAWATGYFNSSSIDIDGDGNNDLTSNGLFDSYV
ncbi:MAG: DUF4347 domain-containing protein, partial [Hormoscilla sp. SP12CHS1]|nr:DUF4347 domain-containing protein [Hormoscilla sp. SP12CHS1]